jgi:TolA-binding protein
MKTISLWLSALLGAGVMTGCSKQTGGGSSSELELQAARQSVKQLQDQLSQVSGEMSERIRKEGERVRAELKPQVDRTSADLDKARRQVAQLEERAKELEALAREAASSASATHTVDPLAMPSDMFLSDAGRQTPGIAVRLADGLLVVRTESGTLATNNIATLREIHFRSGPVLAGS